MPKAVLDAGGALPQYAPVALFAYRRPDHLRRTLDALQRNDLALSTRLLIFCDGATGVVDQLAVDAVRRLAAAVTGFAGVEVVHQPRNLGLARSIISGVSAVTAVHGRVIVVEDDLVVSPHFLRFMNDALDRYADDARIASVNGYMYPLSRPAPDLFFLRDADCWGWATWKRAWDVFDADGPRLLQRLETEGLADFFDFDGGYPYMDMLRDQIAGRNNSWAVRWRASVILADMLSLFPGQSLVHNIGMDGSGEHCSASTVYDTHLRTAPVPLTDIAVEHNPQMFQLIREFHRRQRGL